MKLFAKTLLGVAVATAMAGAAQADSFVEDSSLKITLRNVYFNEMGRSDERVRDRREWVQAVIADYKSGYFMDMVGFDLSAGGAWGLSDEMEGGSSNNCRATNLPKSGNDNNKCDTNDIGGVHQAYAKFKAGSDDVKFNANFGKKKRKFKTYSDSGSRALPSGSYGLEADLDVYGLDLYAANITGFSPRQQSYFKDDLTNGTDQIDYLRIFGAKYDFDFGLGLHAELNRSDDYLKQNWYQAKYDLDLGSDMNLALIGRYGKQEDNGDLYGGEHESKFYDLVAELEMGALGLRAGYTKVSDGAWDTENFDEDHGKWTSNASNHYDFNAEDEKTWVVGASYDFAEVGVEGLNAELYYAKGTDGQSGGSDIGDRWERGTLISYEFGGDLKGLNVEWENYTNRGRGGRDDEDGNRLYVNYSFKVF